MRCTACNRLSRDDWGFDVDIATKMDQREKLREHFRALPPEEQVHGWNAMWQNEITPWDRHQPNPALVEALERKAYLTEAPLAHVDGRRVRKKALVPGCGAGYDVQLFASYGYDAYGLDASTIAVEKAEKHLRDQRHEQQYKLQNIQNGRGASRFIQVDFFEDDWLGQTHAGSAAARPRTFDLVYDYTFLCALPPPLRPKWAARLSRLLSPTGHLICLEYPLGKDPRLGGPPHGLSSPLYEQLFNKPGHEVNYDLNGRIVEDRSLEKTDDALVEVESWVPDKLFGEQKGQIRVSVWRHWKS